MWETQAQWCDWPTRAGGWSQERSGNTCSREAHFDVRGLQVCWQHFGILWDCLMDYRQPGGYSEFMRDHAIRRLDSPDPASLPLTEKG